MLRPFTLAAGLLAASATHAFLIPPEVSQADVADAFGTFAAGIVETQVIKVDCPHCPVFVDGKQGFNLKTDKSSHLELSFSVEHGTESDRLLLNGFELYPSLDAFNDILTAPQVLDKKKKKRDGRKPLTGSPLGYSLQTSYSVEDPDTHLQLVILDLQIIEIGSSFIDGIPLVRVQLIKSPKGSLVISDIEATAVTTPPSEAEPVDKGEECTTFVCRWMAAAKEQFHKLKAGRPCHKGRPGARPQGHERPAWYEHGHGHGHGHGHSHSGHSRPVSHGRSWGQLLKSIASHILLPVLIGIVAGIVTSLVGMAVGTLVVSLWRTFYRRRSHGSHRRRHSKSSKNLKEVAVAEEKAGLVENQDPPPSYEDDVDVKKVDM